MNRLRLALFTSACLAVTIAPARAVDKAPAGTTPVQMVVTVEARHGHDVPVLSREDFMVRLEREKTQVTDAVPLLGGNADLELFILVDEASPLTLGSQLADVRRFINSQAPNTAIGIGYMRNGMVDTAQALTRDHVRAAKALRLPMGAGSSPYLSLSELIKYWPASYARREVLMLTSGADPLGGEGVENPYLDVAIADAQRAGIIVYAIYTGGMGHSAHSYWRMNWGRDYLAKLAEETGGEAYVMIPGTLVSIAPYLAEVTRQLNHQYRITFPANADGKPGLRSVKPTTEVPNAEIVAASKVYVPSVSAVPISITP
ncbi:MAG: hypothetical protein ABSG41_05905 [Bryobacteraceae bacterium]|jgi:hypothetical protein